MNKIKKILTLFYINIFTIMLFQFGSNVKIGWAEDTADCYSVISIEWRVRDGTGSSTADATYPDSDSYNLYFSPNVLFSWFKWNEPHQEKGKNGVTTTTYRRTFEAMAHHHKYFKIQLDDAGDSVCDTEDSLRNFCYELFGFDASRFQLAVNKAYDEVKQSTRAASRQLSNPQFIGNSPYIVFPSQILGICEQRGTSFVDSFSPR